MPANEGAAYTERLIHWTPEREAQALTYDLLFQIFSVLVATGGGKPPDTVPFPRPVTAFQRLEARAASDAHRDLVERLIPSKSGDAQ